MTKTRFAPRPAVRKGQKLRLALDGPTGAGKTYTALLLAAELTGGGNVLVVDTERGSSQLYADRWAFEVVEWTPPYNPVELSAGLGGWSADYDAVIVDSLTHFWDAEGGTLDIVDRAGKRSFGGNRFAGWSEGTPAQNDMVGALVSADCHVIVTMRSKMEYVLGGDDGRTPQKVGMAPIQRAGLEYEFTVVGDLDLAHAVTVSKSRCDLVADKVYRVGHTADLAATLRGWLAGAEPMASHAEVAALTAALNGIGDRDLRVSAKRRFVAEFGSPETLTSGQVAGAAEWIAEVSGGVEGPEMGAGDSSTPAPTHPLVLDVNGDQP